MTSNSTPSFKLHSVIAWQIFRVGAENRDIRLNALAALFHRAVPSGYGGRWPSQHRRPQLSLPDSVPGGKLVNHTAFLQPYLRHPYIPTRGELALRHGRVIAGGRGRGWAFGYVIQEEKLAPRGEHQERISNTNLITGR